MHAAEGWATAHRLLRALRRAILGAAARCAQAGSLAERAARAEAARAAAAAEAAAARRGAAREAAAEQAKLLGTLRRIDFLARPALG